MFTVPAFRSGTRAPWCAGRADPAIPLVVLVVATVLARVGGLLGWGYLDGWVPALAVGLAVMFVVTGLAHFVGRRDDLIAIVPRALPAPALLVTLTGIAEFAGAAGLLVPDLRRTTAVALAVLLVALFPANVAASRDPDAPASMRTMSLPARTALQVVFIAAALVVAVGP